MQEAGPSVLAAWSSFYVITGSSAAALTGLMFVVVTLVAGDRSRQVDQTGAGFETFSAPTVVHFCMAFFISGMLSVPWRSLHYAAAILGLTGLFGIVYVMRVARRTMLQEAYKPLLEDWIWFIILPFLAYVALAITAILLSAMPVDALFVLAAATMLLILVAIHNAWDVVTYIAIFQRGDEGS